MAEGFKCVQCGACCKWSGYVRVNQKEIDLIADFLEMNPMHFIDKYTHLTSDRRGLSLIEKPDGSCIFYNDELHICEINDVKPIQCRNFPLIWNFEGWEKECAGAGNDDSGN